MAHWGYLSHLHKSCLSSMLVPKLLKLGRSLQTSIPPSSFSIHLLCASFHILSFVETYLKYRVCSDNHNKLQTAIVLFFFLGYSPCQSNQAYCQLGHTYTINKIFWIKQDYLLWDVDYKWMRLHRYWGGGFKKYELFGSPTNKTNSWHVFKSSNNFSI